MPIIKFSGIDKKEILEYSKKVNELSKLVNADPENILFINDNSEISKSPKGVELLYITIEWMARPDKQQLVVNNLMEHFKKENRNIFIFITNVDGMLYVNCNKKGISN
ncbi:DUF1904 family protein [Spiroplasma endosymbiont of Crioceris asparagi]|uniref:DUF1904 family protein n=1 Tax=Spiroplasma endosymbiont of Crioceris asparagi TaxID=3066286 RepID=UPI0030D58229